MILSDQTILEKLDAGEIVMDPMPEPEQIQPASVDVRLGDEALMMGPHGRFHEMEPEDGEFNIHPGQCVLGVTMEGIELPNNIISQLTGRSTLGRKFLTVHQTAGFVDPGWPADGGDGRITLEITNFGTATVSLSPGQRIGQLVFMRTDRRTSGYSGQYTGTGPEEAGDL